MKVSITNKQILKLTAPISLALLIPQLNYFTNTVFLGRLGERELGVNGIAGVFYLILAMVGYGLNNGIQIQMARRVGEGNNEGLAETLTNGVMLAVLFALGLMILSLWTVPVIFSFGLSDSENFLLSVNFIYIRVWGLPFLMLTQLANSFFISINRSRFLIYGSLVATGVNIFFDYALIFGKFGLPAWGLVGAAVASVISEFSCCAVVWGIFFFKRFHHVYPVLRHLRFNLKLSKRTLKVSVPLIFQFIFSIGGWLIFFMFIEHLGKRSLAASQMLRNVFGIVGIGVWAFATTCNTMVSRTIGQGRQREVIGLIIKISILSLLYGLISGALLMLFSREFLFIYSNNPDLVVFAIPSLRIIALATIIMSVSTVAFNGVVGTGNTFINLAMEIGSVCIYLVYCYFVIQLWHSPLYMCWGSEFIYWLCLLTGSIFYLKSGRWKGKKI